MVADDQVFFRTGQLCKELTQPFGVLGLLSESKVTDNPKRIFGTNHGPEVLHQNRIHMVARAERATIRSEEHTSELQSHSDLVCRLLLEKKKKPTKVIVIQLLSCTIILN